jgi:hypothetical protein
MIYYAIYTGQGEGCDYTIGCNMTFEKIAEFERLKRELGQ